MILTELTDNPGLSISASVTTVWPQMIARFLPGWLDDAKVLWMMAHYPGGEGLGTRRTDTFDVVRFANYRPVFIFSFLTQNPVEGGAGDAQGLADGGDVVVLVSMQPFG